MNSSPSIHLVTRRRGNSSRRLSHLQVHASSIELFSLSFMRGVKTHSVDSKKSGQGSNLRLLGDLVHDDRHLLLLLLGYGSVLAYLLQQLLGFSGSYRQLPVLYSQLPLSAAHTSLLLSALLRGTFCVLSPLA